MGEVLAVIGGMAVGGVVLWLLTLAIRSMIRAQQVWNYLEMDGNNSYKLNGMTYAIEHAKEEARSADRDAGYARRYAEKRIAALEERLTKHEENPGWMLAVMECEKGSPEPPSPARKK